MSSAVIADLAERVAALELALGQMRALEDVRRLRERYCRYVDAKRWDDLVAILTSDYQHYATNTVGVEPARVADSADAFRRRLEKITAGSITVHACFMPDIALTSATTARGRWSMTDVVSHPTDPRMRFSGQGSYQDEYRRGEDGIWRIAVTRLTRQRLDPLPVRESEQRPGLPGSEETG